MIELGKKFKTRIDGTPAQIGNVYVEQDAAYPYGTKRHASGQDLAAQSRSVDSMKSPASGVSPQYREGYQRGLIEGRLEIEKPWANQSENWRRGYTTGVRAAKREMAEKTLYKCPDCGHTFSTNAFRIRCPNCGSLNLERSLGGGRWIKADADESATDLIHTEDPEPVVEYKNGGYWARVPGYGSQYLGYGATKAEAIADAKEAVENIKRGRGAKTAEEWAARKGAPKEWQPPAPGEIPEKDKPYHQKFQVDAIGYGVDSIEANSSDEAVEKRLSELRRLGKITTEADAARFRSRANTKRIEPGETEKERKQREAYEIRANATSQYTSGQITESNWRAKMRKADRLAAPSNAEVLEIINARAIQQGYPAEDKDRYNGWSNWDTWETALILDNTESTQRWVSEDWGRNFNRKIKAGTFKPEEAEKAVDKYMIPVARGKRKWHDPGLATDEAIDPKKVNKAEIVKHIITDYQENHPEELPPSPGVLGAIGGAIGRGIVGVARVAGEASRAYTEGKSGKPRARAKPKPKPEPEIEEESED